MRVRPMAILVVALVAGTVAACTSTGEGSPRPVPGGQVVESPQSSTAPSSGPDEELPYAYDSVDQRGTGACAVDVGTSNEIAFEVSLQLSAGNIGKKDPCETAAMVAGMVVQTMKAAQ